ncbi:CDC37 [Candida theae]|uniref:Hsp90 chaperone protein kinase-targeting subunit n=1 Tax=Candida theae TaxID=1198502 RepID=A0AAD5FZ81_9ASCO|nr:CDC37 [Candida theae]KAI5959225.1 CDC37 [Candida theae]
MPIDYSKWDKIEISDDSDVEVHPNVDKKSFIRWKQRDIHEKRMQRNIEIKSILVQLTMYAKLNERVEYLLEQLSPEQLLNDQLVLSTLKSKFDSNEKFDYEKLIASKGDTLRKGLQDLSFDREEIENTPTYNEMIEDLFIQIKDDHADAKADGAKLGEYLKEHRAKIDDVLSKQTIKLDDLLNQKAQLIVSDDLHTGFDRSFMNKDKPEEEGEEKVTDKKKVVEKEKPNVAQADSKVATSPTTANPANVPKESTNEHVQTQNDGGEIEKALLDELELMPETDKFGSIDPKDLSASADYLIKHTKICTEQQKDALMMTAFDAQLSGDPSATKRIVHQALLLQYVVQIRGNNKSRDDTIRAIKLFFTKFQNEEKVQGFFNEEYTNTVNHITQRCKVIEQEQANRAANDEEEALIQLRALDENTTLTVNIPEDGTKEYEIFSSKLPTEFQTAIKTQSLDEVNKEFAKLKVEEAEKILEIFNECGVIGINGYLEDEQEFEELKKEYNEQEHEDTNDVVD